MGSSFDPRGDLPPPTIQHMSRTRRPISSILDYDSRRRSFQAFQKLKSTACQDWMFSSSTNTHIAIDKSSFKQYTPLTSYVLSLADQRRIEVKGIGLVELRIRCKPGSRSDRTIVLENVLHIPEWLCNIFSDIYFMNTTDFKHTWTDFGVIFMVHEKGKLRCWGYTENFCGLDRLVLSHRQDGRSPMLDDVDREVYSVNVNWPQSQQDLWHRTIAQHLENGCNSDDGMTEIGRKVKAKRPASEQGHRPRLSTISSNIMSARSSPGKRISSLRATLSSWSLAQITSPT